MYVCTYIHTYICTYICPYTYHRHPADNIVRKYIYAKVQWYSTWCTSRNRYLVSRWLDSIQCSSLSESHATNMDSSLGSKVQFFEFHAERRLYLIFHRPMYKWVTPKYVHYVRICICVYILAFDSCAHRDLSTRTRILNTREWAILLDLISMTHVLEWGPAAVLERWRTRTLRRVSIQVPRVNAPGRCHRVGAITYVRAEWRWKFTGFELDYFGYAYRAHAPSRIVLILAARSLWVFEFR